MNRELSTTPSARHDDPAIMDFAHAVADEKILRASLEAADVAPQAMVLAHLTGDDTLLEELRPYIHGAWNFMEDVPPEMYRHFKRHFSAGPSGAQPAKRPLGRPRRRRCGASSSPRAVGWAGDVSGQVASSQATDKALAQGAGDDSIFPKLR